MKRYILIILILVFSLSLNAQNNNYLKAMKNAIAIMDTSSSSIEYIQYAANDFERIGQAMKNEWLPFYYSAYCHVQLSHLVKKNNERDIYINKAVELNNKADNISQDNSEIYVMKGFILQAYMDIEPMTRGMKYSLECISMFKNAQELDHENPRSYLWHAVQLFNMPTFLGGGTKKAFPLLKKALEKYETFQPESEIHPCWGLSYADKMFAKYNIDQQ